jgi:hypothetical protein
MWNTLIYKLYFQQLQFVTQEGIGCKLSDDDVKMCRNM